jgi:hypothetical protein
MGRDIKQGSAWTEADIAHVMKRWNVDGVTATVIGRELGRSRNAICGMINRNRKQFNHRPSGPPPVARRRETQLSAAPKLPIVPKRRSSWLAGEIDMAERLWAEGMSIDRMAKNLGKSIALVKHLIRNNRARFPKRYTDDGNGRRLAALASKPNPAKAESIAPRKLYDPVPHAPDSQPVGLEKRRVTQCAFPLWASFAALPTAQSPYCGAAIDRAETYCAFHQRLMYPAVAARAAA